MRRTIVVVVLAFATYLPSGFFCDDALLRESIARMASWESLRYTIDTNALGIYLWPLDAPMVVSYFRPLVMASMKLESALGGPNAVLGHAINLILHVLNVVIAARIGGRLGLNPTTASLAALVWGVSIHAAPAVGWISGRSELLAAVGILTGVWIALAGGGRPERRWPWLCGASLVLACTAKESAVVAPLLVVLACAAAGTSPRNILSRRAWLLALVAPIVLYAGLLAVSGWPRLPQPYFEPIVSTTAVTWLIAKLTLYTTSAMVGLPIVPVASREWLESHIVLAMPMAVLSVLALRGLRRRAGARAHFLMLWFVVALAPYALVTAFSLYLYLPLLGVCWLFGAAIQNARGRWTRAWVTWLAVSGVVGNLVAGLYLCRVNAATERSVEHIASVIAARDVRDVVIFDAPYWSYSLPSAVRMRHPAIALRTHFITMSARPGPSAASPVAWSGARELTMISPQPLFRSPIERFFLFGTDPRTSRQATTRDVYRVSWDSGPHDGRDTLRVQFTDSLTGMAVLQFDRWTLRDVDGPAVR